jgi:hypothetical protein
MTFITVRLRQFDMAPCGSGLAIISLPSIGRFRRIVAFGDWSFGEWSPSEIGRLENGRPENGRSEIGRLENGRPENGRLEIGRSEIGRCTKKYNKKYFLKLFCYISASIFPSFFLGIHSPL